jgi:hypothetical protein
MRAESFSLRLRSPPMTNMETSEMKAKAAEKRVNCW